MSARAGQHGEREKRVGRGRETLSGCRGAGFQPSPTLKCPTSERLWERP